MAELVDALASGASGSNPVEVQVLLSAPTKQSSKAGLFSWYCACDVGWLRRNACGVPSGSVTW